MSGASDDTSLTATGISQCSKLLQQLKQVPFHHVICSPLRRAIQTCELSGFALSRVEIDQLTIEKSFGNFEGRPVQDYEQAIVHLSSDEIFKTRVGSSESFEDLQARVLNFKNTLVEKEGKVILLFSHAAFNRCFLGTLSNKPFSNWLDFPQENASIQIVNLE